MLDQTILGVIDATEWKSSLTDLTLNRSIAAIPFAGRYRLIDFILSNMVHSGIINIAIFPRFRYRSLMEHIGTGEYWDLNRRKDGLFFFPSPDLQYNHDEVQSFQHYEQHIDYFWKSTQKYVFITNHHTICYIDFKEVMEDHIQSGCDITEIVYSNKSLQMYICDKTVLLTLLKTKDKTGYKGMKDVVNDSKQLFLVNQYEYQGYVAIIDSIEAFFKHNLDLIKPQNWKQLFRKDAPIFTKPKDEPPTKYTDTAHVKNSVIANGCMIEGHVENSILFSGVRVAKGASVKNSIVMQNSKIGLNGLIEYAILDKNVKVKDDVEVFGTENMPYVIQKGKVQGALMNS